MDYIDTLKSLQSLQIEAHEKNKSIMITNGNGYLFYAVYSKGNKLIEQKMLHPEFDNAEEILTELKTTINQ